VRLETRVPFTIQVCVNGWEWLAHQLDKAVIGYEKRDNCFAHIEDLPQAQKMMDSLISRKWVPWLNVLAERVNPLLAPQHKLNLGSYCWTMREGEYSTDVIFKGAASLLAIYPALIAHAIHNFMAKDVLRFLQKRLHGNFNGELRSDRKTRVEGTRIKHWAHENSIKMYDKQGSVLRIEVTINNPRRWRQGTALREHVAAEGRVDRDFGAAHHRSGHLSIGGETGAGKPDIRPTQPAEFRVVLAQASCPVRSV
jgi:hypothetical protein